MKIYMLVENLTFIFSLNAVRFFTTYYLHRADGTYSVYEVIFDSMLAIVTTWFLVMSFMLNRSLFSKGSLSIQDVRKRSMILKWISIFGIKLAGDAVILFAGRALVGWNYVVEDILTIAYWVVSYVVLVQPLNSVWKNKGQILQPVVILLAVFGLSLCCDFYMIRQIDLLHAQYSEVSPYLLRSCRNLNFLNSVKVFALDTAVIFGLVIFHTKQLTGERKEDHRGRGDVIRVLIRCDLIMVMFLLVAVSKIALDPQGVLIVTENPVRSESSYGESEFFDLSISKQQVIYGMEIEPSSECSCYYMETVSLQGNDGKTVTFRNNGAEPSLVFSDKGREAGTYIQFTIEDSNVYLFGHYAICYYENGIPYILRMDSLNQSGEHLVVIELLRHLLEEGNLFVFEYAGNYLVKYDPTFIASYIQRYSRGQFTENELRWMEESFYNPGYIIDLAKDLAK